MTPVFQTRNTEKQHTHNKIARIRPSTAVNPISMTVYQCMFLSHSASEIGYIPNYNTLQNFKKK
jgi:hypothetical protein